MQTNSLIPGTTYLGGNPIPSTKGVYGLRKRQTNTTGSYGYSENDGKAFYLEYSV